MATLSRVFAKLFGSNADPSINGQIGQFGSAKAGTKLNTADIATIQALPAYLTGWAAAVMTGRNFPPIEEVTGVLKTFSYQICYMLQEGIPEWDATTEYSATSVTKVINGNQLDFYISKREQSGNQPQTDDGTNWVKAIITGDREVGVPQITLDFSGNLPDNCIDLLGQLKKITSDTSDSDYKYQILYSIYGTNYNLQNDPAGYFRLPDFFDCCIWGGTSAGTIDAGLPSLTATTAGAGKHSHSIASSGNHTHTTNDAGRHKHSSRGTSDEDDGGGRFTSGVANTDAAIYTDYVDAHHHTISSSGAHTHTTNEVANHTHTVTITPSVSGIYGNSNTVQPPAIKVRVFTRYQ